MFKNMWVNCVDKLWARFVIKNCCFFIHSQLTVLPNILNLDLHNHFYRIRSVFDCFYTISTWQITTTKYLNTLKGVL
jgi:hypothetical protein